MDALAPSQCSAWLAGQQLRETPSARDPWGGQYTRLNNIAAPGIADALVESLSSPINVLLQFTDLSVLGHRALPASLALLDEVAPATGDWPQHSTRGLLFAEEDERALRECCVHLLVAGASAFLYAPNLSLTIGLWESEFIELWCPDLTTITAVVGRLALHSARVCEQ
jgi:hypothetical protein